LKQSHLFTEFWVHRLNSYGRAGLLRLQTGTGTGFCQF
jgi:hypothetical protein